MHKNYKMAIIFMVLTIIIAMPGAQAQEASTSKLTVKTDTDVYAIGNTIVVTVVLQEHSDPKNALTLIVKNPSGNIVYVGQADPTAKSPEIFKINSIGGKWSESGPYTIVASYGSLSAIKAFEFVSDSKPKSTDSDKDKEELEQKNAAEAEKLRIEEAERKTAEAEKLRIEEAERKTAEAERMKQEQMTTCAAGEVKKNGECVSICGDGTQFVDGQCTTICGSGTEWDGKRCIATEETTKNNGGCLIATAAYGTELAPQIQTLREVRDNTLMKTDVGSSFMAGFNTLYYMFSPTIADWERQSPAFASTVGTILTPMISTLSIMSMVEDTNASALALGISVIALNLGIYIGTPVGTIYGIKKIIRHSSI